MTQPMNRFFVVTMLVMAFCYLLPWHVWLVTNHVLAVRLGWLGVGVMFAGMALTARRLPWRGMRLLYMAVVLICIPALVPHDGTSFWLILCRLTLLVMAVLMVAMLASNARVLRSDRVVATGLLTSGIVVAVWTLVAFYLPDLYFHFYQMEMKGGRLPGLLYQANVTGSFLAVVVMLGLWRWLRGGKQHTASWMFMLAVCMAAIHVTQSTVALLGVVTGFILLSLAFGCGERRAFTLSAFVLLAGWTATLWHPGTGIFLRSDYESSWGFRLQMLRACIALVAVKPWLGWGYGTFAGIFPEGLAFLNEQQIDPTTVLVHPHNELMYWMVEGGLVAGAGIVLMAWWGVRLLIRAFPGHLPSEDALHEGDSWGWCVCLVPVVLHMQTEYPLYVSALHWLVLVLCVGLALAAMRERDTTGQQTNISLFAHRKRQGLTGVVRSTGVLLAMAVIWLTLTATNVDIQIARLMLLPEKYPLQSLLRARDLNMWVDHPQALRAQATSFLTEYNRTHDTRLLPPSIRWLHMSVSEYPDPTGYRQLLAILQHTGDVSGEFVVQTEMHRRIRYVPPDIPAGLSRQ